MRSIHAIAGVVAAIVAALPATAPAQGAASRSVTLVQLDRQTDKPAMVYRLAGEGSDRDIIALAPSATSAHLVDALRVLDAMYARFGPTLQHDVAAAVRKPTPSRSVASRDMSGKQYETLVAELRRAARRQVRTFGSVRSLQIRVSTL
jgi:hypothetical protein